MKAVSQSQGIGRRERLWLDWAAFLTSWLLRGLFLTLRPVYVQEHFEHRARNGDKPILLALWHGRSLYIIHRYRQSRSTVLVSQSKDGEFISRILTRFGIRTARGSSSRGGVKGLVQMVRRLRQGCSCAFTPDGPRGPRYRVQPGVVAVAKKTGTPILPLTCNAQWKCVLGSWDRFIVPLPFSRVVVIYGEPIYVSPTASAATLLAKQQQVEASLRRITEMADSYFGVLRTE